MSTPQAKSPSEIAREIIDHEWFRGFFKSASIYDKESMEKVLTKAIQAERDIALNQKFAYDMTDEKRMIDELRMSQTCDAEVISHLRKENERLKFERKLQQDTTSNLNTEIVDLRSALREAYIEEIPKLRERGITRIKQAMKIDSLLAKLKSLVGGKEKNKNSSCTCGHPKHDGNCRMHMFGYRCTCQKFQLEVGLPWN